jgi:CRP/FNR family transcriptional regulator, cyclic AMP receptor protein
MTRPVVPPGDPPLEDESAAHVVSGRGALQPDRSKSDRIKTNGSKSAVSRREPLPFRRKIDPCRDGRDGFSFPVPPEFAQLGSEARSALIGALVARSYAANDFIYLQDDEAENLYFIRSGYVRLSYLMEDGSAILCGILPPGDTFGELGIFENGTHCDMATAVGEVAVVSVPASAYRSLGMRYPEINAVVGRVVARRYRSYVALTRMLSLKTLAARLAQALLRLADGLGERMQLSGRDVAYIGSMVTQADLGLMARGARGNVNRALKSWERAGWIVIQDRCIAVLDRARLEALALEEGL